MEKGSPVKTLEPLARAQVIVIEGENPYLREQDVNFNTEKCSNCKIHSDKKLDMFCKTCDEQICEKCAHVNHRDKHKVVDFLEVIAERIEHTIVNKDILMHQILPVYEERTRKMETDYKDMQEKYTAVKEIIKATAARWHGEIDDVIEHILQDLQEMEREHLQRLAEEKEKVDTILAEIQSILDESKKLLSNPVKLTEENMPKADNFTTFPQLSLFHPPSFSEGKLQNMTDRVSIDNRIVYSPNYQLPLKAAYGKSCVCLAELKRLKEIISPEHKISTGITTQPTISKAPVEMKDQENIGDIAAFSPKIALIANTGIAALQVNNNGEVQRAEDFAGIHFLTLGRGSHLYFTDSNEKNVGKVYFKLDDPNACTTTPMLVGIDWTPYGITATRDGHILVCCQNQTHGKVVEFDENLQKVKEFENDSQSEPHFEKPKMVAENRNGDICVTDMAASPSVVILKKDGKLRKKYQPDIPSNSFTGFFTRRGSSFTPGGICTDRMGHILISDTRNRVIHILNQWGEFQQFLLKSLLQDPRALSIDSAGQLWIVEGQKNLKVVKYLHGCP